MNKSDKYQLTRSLTSALISHNLYSQNDKYNNPIQALVAAGQVHALVILAIQLKVDVILDGYLQRYQRAADAAYSDIITPTLTGVDLDNAVNDILPNSY